MNQNTPFISAIIPNRNEEKYLPDCLQSICESDYPKDQMEVLVVDGLSTDRSRAIVAEFSSKHPFIRLIDNPKLILAAAWNIGVKESQGNVVFAMNAHAVIEPNYFRVCLKYLESHHADCVGPVIETHPQDETVLGKSIAAALSSPFGVGQSRFRTGVDKPTWVDTVHCCAYRKEVFQRIGFYNEELVRSQDIDLHMRLKRTGGRILLVPDIKIHYFTRSSLKGFVKYGFINGYWVSRPYCFGAFMAGIRHMVPMVFFLSLLLPTLVGAFYPPALFLPAVTLALYFILAFTVSARTAFEKKSIFYFLLMPAVFFCFHLTYGIGCTGGMVQAFFSTRFWRRLFKGDLVLEPKALGA
jgi:GT2 family glycosyltransferase